MWQLPDRLHPEPGGVRRRPVVSPCRRERSLGSGVAVRDIEIVVAERGYHRRDDRLQAEPAAEVRAVVIFPFVRLRN
jgi:hypothetical protein